MKRIFLILISILALSCSKKEDEPIKYSISSPDEISLKVGDVKEFKYTLDPPNEKGHIEPPLVGDNNIAKYDYYHHTITGLKEGETVLTMKGDVEDQKLYKEVKVIVLTVDVEGVSLDKNESILEVEKTIKLTANILPKNANYKKVKWTSSDENIATVENGLVTAKSEGECNIIASIEGKEAICKITVKPISVKSISIQSTSLKNESLDILIGKNEKLIASILPEKAKNKNVIWTSSDPSIVKVSQEGVITAIKTGIVNIICTSEMGGVSSTLTINSKEISDFISVTTGMTFGSVKNSYVTAFMYSSITNDSKETIQLLGLTIINNKNNLVYLNKPYNGKDFHFTDFLQEGINLSNEYKPDFTFVWTLSYKGKQFTVKKKSNPSYF